MIGAHVAHFEIAGKLGEGGMGEVYRATDAKLNRDVAIKILPEAFAKDAGRMAQFRRAAQVLAAPPPERWPSPWPLSASLASLTGPDRLPCMRCSIPRWTGPGARWLASCAFPRGFLPCPCSLPRYRGGPASTSLLSRPAQASPALRPAKLLTHHTWALSRGFALAGFPARALASYQVQPTNSLGGSFPHW